jgi:DNA-binding winged helix-turn-helix (wHTH) protein
MTTELQFAERNAAAQPAGKFPTRYARFGAFQLDVKRQDLLKNGARLRLPGKVCQVLITLLERPGEIVTREELRARLWPSDTHVNFDANVNTTVNKLRQILGDSNEESMYVQTVPRKGYSFITGVEFSEQPMSIQSAAAPHKPNGLGPNGLADDLGGAPSADVANQPGASGSLRRTARASGLPPASSR